MRNACTGILLVACCVAWDAEKQASSTLKEPEQSGIATARRGTATVEEAYRQFLALAVNQNRADLKQDLNGMSFEEVSAQLEALSVIDPEWSYTPQTCLRRDVLAYMCASYLGCRPGLLTSVCGMTRRYAHREMLYRQIIAPGAPATLVTGSELLSVLTRVSRLVEPRRDVQLTDDEIH